MKPCPRCKKNPSVYKSPRLCKECNAKRAKDFRDKKRGLPPRPKLPRIDTKCTICGITFRAMQGSLDRGWAKTCSRKCFHIRYGRLKKGKFSGSNKNSLHLWVRNQLGDPRVCMFCHKTEGKFDWSNISNEYKKDLSDWQRLCRSCHMQYDWNKIMENRRQQKLLDMVK